MHRWDGPTAALAEAVVSAALTRIRLDPPPLDHPRPQAELDEAAGPTITPEGLGGLEALRRFTEVLAPACLSIDHPRFWAFVPGAPSEAATLFDLLVSATSVYAGSWLEGAGAVWAENQALAWLAGLAGFPEGAGGVFVSGGTAASLSALVVARHRWRQRTPGADRRRGIVVTTAGAHSSIVSAARVMDADVWMAPSHRLTARDRARVFAVVATAGTTNDGVVEDLSAAADVAEDLGAWFHVDGAYGAAALCVPSARHRFSGIERADSFCVDPHKWLFAPYDSAALLYRAPAEAGAAHTQHAAYLDVLTQRPEWNPSDYAHHLTRRARGLPFWFSLAANGTDAYTAAVEHGITLARAAARLVEATPGLELVQEPQLSVVLFRRSGWGWEDYEAWGAGLLADGTAFVVPTWWQDRPTLRCCFVNPRTTVDDVRAVLATLA